MADMRLYATADYVYFTLIDYGYTDFEDTPPIFEAGDSKISIDGGSFANTTNLPTHVGGGTFRVLITTTEFTGKKMMIAVKDQSVTPLWEDQAIYIETYGDDNAQHPYDLAMGSRAYATEDFILFPLITYGDTDFIGSPPTFAAGDVKISRDGGSYGNTTNLPTHIGEGIFKLVLTTTEHTAKKMLVTVKDQDGPAWEDQAIYIETYGGDNAQFPITTFNIIEDAPAGDICRVYEYVYDQDGNPPTTLDASAKIISQEIISGTPYTLTSENGTYDSSTGLVYWDIIQGAEVAISIEEADINRIITVPSTGTARLSDIE